MIVDFKSIKHDFYGVVEQPVLTLKTPHGTTISTITYISPKLKLRYNDVSEIEFSVPAYNNGEKINNYDEILGDRLVEVEPFGDFILVNPEIENEGGIKEVKKCKAYSKEYALNYKRLNIPAGTYNFYNPVDNENTITTMILEVLPDWTFGDIDSELIGRWRTFENTEDNLYSFMMNTLQETYNCLFLFDTFNKKINVISASKSIPSLPIYLSYNNLLKTVNVTELSDEVITVLSGYGSGDEVDIRSANPNGTNKIYNLDYYISRGDLPDDLTDKWLSYRDMVDLYQDVFSNFNVLYNQKNAELIAGQASLIEAKTEYDAINTTYLTAQTNENPDMEAIANLESELEKAKTKVETCQTLVDEVLKPDLNEIIKQRQDIVKLCKLDSNFSKDEIKILSQYFKEDSITEDTFVIPEYSASSSANISNRIQDSSKAKIKITGSQIYATNIAEIFDMDTDGFYKSTYTDPDTGEEQYFTSNIDAFEGMEMPSTIENTVVDQLNENLKRKMYEFRGGIFELNFKSEIASEGKLFEKDQYIKGDVVNVDFSYNTDNLDAYVDENSPDTTKARGFIVCANLRNADYSGTSYPSMNITLQGMIRKEVPQVGKDFLSFDIESAIFSCTGSVTEYQKQNVIQELYDYTKDSLIKLAYPSYEFSVESGNFIFAKEFEPFKDKLELGCRINLMLDDEEENLLQPILIEIDLNYDDDSDFSIVFSNKFNSNDSEFKLADLITENTRSSRSVSLNKGSYNAYKDNNTKTQIDNLTYGALDVAKNKIINSANQAVEWNSSGLFLRKYAANGGYEDRQVGLISDTIAFTKDNWKTVDIAIGALDDPNTGSGYGIIAPSIFGTLLCGKNLVIDNPVYKDDGTTISKQFKVDSTGAWLNNSSFVLSQDASEDFAGGKIIIDPRYGIAAGNLNLFTLGDSEGNNGTEIHPSFMDDDGNIIFDETKLIETSEGSIPYVPKNTTFFFNIRTGDAYFGGDINAENIIAGTFNGEVIKPGSIGGDAIANDAINSEHISSIDADSVTISNLSSDNFTGGKIVADSVTTEGLSANVIEAINASIGKIDADKIVSGSVQAGELIIDGENGKLAILPEYGIIAGNSNIFTIVDGEIIPSFKDDNGELIIDENTGAPLNSSFYFDINTGKAYFAGSINASQITSGTISADIIKGSVIEAINLSAGQINADRVNITDGYITNAMIDNLDAGKIKTGTLDASLATIVNLDASNITTGLLNAEYIDTDSISADFANTVVSHVGEAQIHSAMIKDLTFDKITGFDVNTTNLTIHSEDGKSQWYDNTIQISDANRVRVQIGKDASNDYSMYVWDATGNLMFDALGLTDSGIQREIIRNDMVAEDAAINGSKLDIESVFREMDGSTYTITSNHLTYDGKSLDLTLQSMSETDKEQGQLLSSQGTQITAIQGQIASKIWQQDIDTATGEMNTKYSELEQELDGFKTTVGETYSTKAEAEVLAEAARNAQKTAEDAQTDLDNAKANLADVTSRVDATEEDIAAAQKAVDDAQTAANNAQKAAVAAKSAADQAQSDVNALTKRVETAETSISQNTEQISLRATKTEVATAKDEATAKANQALTESKSYTDAQIKVSADNIKSTVSSTYATKTENQAALSAAQAAQDDIDNLEIGGRNLFIETDYENIKTQGSTSTRGWYQVNNIKNKIVDDNSEKAAKIAGNSWDVAQYVNVEAGETYTMSCFARLETERSGAKLLFRPDVLQIVDKNFDKNLTTDYQKFTYTWTCEVGGIERIHIRTANANDVLYVKKIKFEKGNKATDWTPAPDDVDAATQAVADDLANNYSTTTEMNSVIDQKADAITSSVSKTYATKEALTAAETRITQTENNISSQVIETNGLKERVSTVEQTADGLEVRLTAAESGNLIKNGYGELLDNTNFSGGTFTRGDCPSGCYGYFNDGTTDLIPFNPNRIYEYNYFVRLHNGSSGSNYFSIQPFDIDGNLIAIAHVPWYNSNLFYLSEDLKDGDTVVHFTDLTNWRTDTTQTYQRSFLIFNYTDSTGYTYPPGTYSRNYYSDIYEDNTSVDLTNNTITLKEAWNKGTIAAGTCISQTSAGSTYCYYGQTGSITNTEWKNYNGTIYAGDVGGSINENTLRLLYAKKIRISLYNNVADYAGLYLGEKIIDQEARRTATNFLSYDATNGLLVGNKSSGEWSGYRSQMLPTAFNILDADGNTLSSFGANDIELGKNNRNASINLCDGLGIIRTEDADDTLYKRMIISTDDATSKPTLIDLKTKNVTCGGMWSNNEGETFESRLYVNTLRPWSTSSADATPYISLVSRMFKTTGIYNDGVISNIRVDGDSEYGYIRIQTNSEVSTDERYISTDPVGVKFSPQRRTADTYNFTGGNIEFYGGTVTVNGTAVSLDGHKHNALYHTSSGNLCLTCIQDSGTYYVRKGSSMSDINVCSGSNTYPWYNVYTENLRVSGGKPVFTYIGSDGSGSTVSYATNMYVASGGTVSRTTNTSSRTIKHDIMELKDNSIKADNLYDVNVYQAKYNEDVLSSDDPRYLKDLPMFIIEDLDEKYPVVIDKPSENVKEWSWNAQYLIPPMLKLIQMQHQTDIDLENKIKDLESKLDKALEIINNLTNN